MFRRRVYHSQGKRGGQGCLAAGALLRKGDCVSISDMARGLRVIGFCALLSSAVFGQQAMLVNPDFERGEPNARRPGWLFGYGPGKFSYFTWTTIDSCNSGKQCALILSSGPETVFPLTLTHSYSQYVDAKPYRGMKFRFRAAVRRPRSPVRPTVQRYWFAFTATREEAVFSTIWPSGESRPASGPSMTSRATFVRTPTIWN